MDSQRMAVYEAESSLRQVLEVGGPVEVAGSTLTLPIERRFGNVDNVRDYVKRVHSIHGGDHPLPRVRQRRGDRWATYDGRTNTLAIPDSQWALRELVVLHEYAHGLTWWNDRQSGHGPEFCSRYVDLVRDVIGPEAGFILSWNLWQAGCSVS